jgi:TonB family protein
MRLLPLVALVPLACATGNATTRLDGAPARASARTSGYEVREALPDDGEDRGAMGLQAEQGFLSREDAEDAIKRHWRDLVRCYERAGAARDYAGGAVKLRFVVDPQGRPSEVHVLESRLGNLDVERCLVTVGQTITFPRPQNGARTSVEYSLEFRASGEIPVVDLPEGVLARAFLDWLPRLAEDCPQVGADGVIATVYGESRGTVRSVGFSSATPLPEEAARCLSQSLRRWTVRLEGPRGLWRGQVALRQEDFANPPRPQVAAPVRRGISQGRRGGRR